MVNDISKTTISILLVLTVLVSILGTWVTLESISQPNDVQIMPDNTDAGGKISINVKKPNLDDSRGTVSINVGGE